MADEVTFQNDPVDPSVEFPGDPGSWLVEDQYMLGTGLLAAPLFVDASERRHTGELDWDGARAWRPAG